jgi:FAD/FMN-containing dehydrogenase
VYLNHASSDDAPEKIRASFGSNYTRLRHIKTQYDPSNLFRQNANIPPG